MPMTEAEIVAAAGKIIVSYNELIKALSNEMDRLIALKRKHEHDTTHAGMLTNADINGRMTIIEMCANVMEQTKT